MEKTTAYLGLFFMLIGFILLVISVNRGKRIVDYLKHRYSQQWEDMGKPEPALNRWREKPVLRSFSVVEGQRLNREKNPFIPVRRGRL